MVVISDGFWRRSFGADRRVLGRNIRLNDYTFTIVGVAGRGFTGTDVGSPTDVWLPLAMQREIGRDLLTDARTNWLEMFGRLGSGKSLDRAGDELSAYLEAAPSARLTHSPHRRLVLLPGAKGNSMMRRELGPALQVFMALSALAMLLACINVANLLTLRSAARDKEIAVRLALGAGRPRLTRQFMTETLVLAALAGSAGLLSAPWAGRLLIASQPLAREIETGLNARVLMFAFALSVLSAVAVALAPVLGSRRIGLSELLGNSSGAPRTAGRTARVHDVVVTLQIAMSVAMLITAALLTQSLCGLKSVNPGFRADDLLLITMDPGAAGYDGDRLERFWRAAVDRVSQIDEVQSVSLARTVPLTPDRQRQPWLSPASGELHEIDTNFIGPRYFRTLGVPILRGREFDARDVKASRPVVIVNERLARMFWPGQDAVGKGLRLAGLGGTGQSSPVEPPSDAVPEVIGVVRDVKYRDLRGDYAPLVYRPLFQTNSSDPMTLHVRARGDAGMVALRIRSEMRFVDAQVPLFGITTLEGLMDSSFAQTRQAAGLTAAFGILALVLSGMGVYGVTALATTRRTRELAIRIALGASRRHMTALIAHRGIIVTGVGLTIGLLAALGFGQISRALLYGITATESAASFAGTAALVSLVATAAFYFPFRAATRLDIATAIRYE